MQKLLDVFPLSVVIPILSKQTGGNDSEHSSDFLASTVIRTNNIGLVENYIRTQKSELVLSVLKQILEKLKSETVRGDFVSQLFQPISKYCVSQLKEGKTEYGDFLVDFRSLLGSSIQTRQTSAQELKQPTLKRIRKEELIGFVIDALNRKNITACLPTLKASFPDFANPFQLFRTIVLQKVWEFVCQKQLNEASQLIENLGEKPTEHFYELWRQTTRNQTRELLFKYLNERGVLSDTDKANYEILQKITKEYPNTSFTKAQKLSTSPALRTVDDDAKLPPWKPIVDLTTDFNENANLIFAELFNIPPEETVDSPHYFVGNIELIEKQTPSTKKMLRKEGKSVKRLWILHCEHNVNQMKNLFIEEINASKGPETELKCLKFINQYYAQMNVYELETLLDILCQNGYFAQFEKDDFELLLVRICKNKFLFDSQWWNTKCTLKLEEFFKDFGRFCAKKSLFMPFEMFVISHQETKKFDLSDIDEPLIRFIWDLWVKRDPSAATLSCMQFIAKSNSTDQVELWKSLPNESLAPLASWVWNKDPEKFKQGSPELDALSERLRAEYPLLSSLVKNEIPHPKGPEKVRPESKWRSPIFTSKYDLELHDLIASHFDYNFSKVFTDYYGHTPGQPNYPHFDHPELIASPSEPPYVYYVKSMLPVSAFQQAVDDNIDENKFKDLCHQCMKESLFDPDIRLAALTFIELSDIKFNRDSSIDYKLSLSIYDELSHQQSVDSETLVNDISEFYLSHSSDAGIRLQKRLTEPRIEIFLLKTLLGVRCNLPLDYTPIRTFSKRPRPAELLLFIDRASELGAHYPISEVVKIVREEMPESKDNPLKDHLLFHLTQSLPAEEGPSSSEVPPALVVFRAIRNVPPDQQHTALLQEALNRKSQLYALLATSIDGSDNMLCALVTLMTMIDAPPPLDVQSPPPHDVLLQMFMSLLVRLLQGNKSLEVLQNLKLYSDTSIAVHLVEFYRSVELFSFRRSEQVLPHIREKLELKGLIVDDLLSSISVSVIQDTFNELVTILTQHCASKTSLHVFRFLSLLYGCPVSDFLSPRVTLCHRISTFSNYRRAIFHCDLLGPSEQVVSDLVLNHSLSLGQCASECLGTSSASATQQWLTFQYSTAATPQQVLDIHRQIVSDIQHCDRLFFVSLYASLLPYSEPTFCIDIITYALRLFEEMHEEDDLTAHIRALVTHLQICNEEHIQVDGPSGPLPNLLDILRVLFPQVDISTHNFPQHIPLSIASPVLFSLDTLQRFFDTSVDISIDHCLDNRRVDDALQLCEWRGRDPHNIELLETVQKLVTHETLSSDDISSLSEYGYSSSTDVDLESVLDRIATTKKWRFVLISLHYKACKRLHLSTEGILKHKTSEFVSSTLSVEYSQWSLVTELIKASKMSAQESATCLAESFSAHVQHTLEIGDTAEGFLPISDYGDKFREFTQLCSLPSLVCDSLYDLSVNLSSDTSLRQKVNLLLHSSLFTSDIDEVAETLDSLLDTLTCKNELDLIVDIVTVFRDPSLLPRFFQYLIAQQKLDILPHSRLSANVGRVIMNCARHVLPFEPQKYFDLTLQYSLFRDHAELQMECGSRCLQSSHDKSVLQEASRHYLLALSYFLHEKCYSLSIECLKKLSLISLQLEEPEPSILHLDKSEVLRLMCTKDFPFALTLAVSYDMDTEQNWSEALYAQSVVNKCDDFLTAFQYFRPITSNLCDCVVRKYKSSPRDDVQRDRMKSFLHNIPNLVERYRISKSLDFQDQLESMKEVNPVVCEWCERVLMSKQ